MRILSKLKNWVLGRHSDAKSKAAPNLAPAKDTTVQRNFSSALTTSETVIKKRKSPTRKPKKKTRNPTYGRTATTKTKYRSRNDGTEIDKLVSHLEKVLPEGIEFSISGINSPPRNLNYRSDWIVAQPEAGDKYRWRKRYKVGLLFTPTIWELNGLVEELKQYQPDSTTNFYEKYRKPIADKIHQNIQNFVSPFDPDFKVTAGIKSSGKVTAWIEIWLPICAHDLVVHCGGDLSDFPKKLLNEFEIVVERLIGNDQELFVKIYKDYDVRFKFMRRADQIFRKQQGVPKIGEGLVTQLALYKLIKKQYPRAIYEYSPRFLKGMRYDIYIPSLRLAIEYHGAQHYQPVSIYGGEDGFASTVKRDKRKVELSKANRVFVFEWPHTRAVNEFEVERLFLELKIR